jgi:valyl-tRNA synthetase
MEQSQDVLDTWFSSAIWPFGGLSKEDVKDYYPGNALVTARDIINLWVARMIFSGLEFQKKVPFTDVFINGTILTKDGKRMSKSLGTGIDPLGHIDRFGADATRFGIIWQASGQDIRWDEAAVIAGRKFANKIWNASRFVLTQIENTNPSAESKHSGGPATMSLRTLGGKTAADKEILGKLAETKGKLEKDIEGFEFSPALHDLYEFFWHEFCDKYIEESKKQCADEKLKANTRKILAYTLKESLKMLHPFMPFITEAIYGHLPTENKDLLIVETW